MPILQSARLRSTRSPLPQRRVAAIVCSAVLALCAVSQPAQPGSRLVERFQQLDRNSDGKLTRYELPDAPWVKRFDTNADGMITLDEARAAVSATVEKIADVAGLHKKQWTVDGVVREAFLAVPKASKMDVPVVFVFHGHGGTMGHAAATFGMHKQWPEALCVYMQGLPTPGMTDPNGMKPGWQKFPGDQNDRDVNFFDAVLNTLKKEFKVDGKRIYVTGHSNGGQFTYLLWSMRGHVFAAVAPSAAGLGRGIRGLEPLPALHVAGENDELVSFKLQQRMMEHVRNLNGCAATGTPWATAGDITGTIFPSPKETPFVSLIHPGNHKFPAEAPALMVKFFKEHKKK